MVKRQSGRGDRVRSPAQDSQGVPAVEVLEHDQRGGIELPQRIPQPVGFSVAGPHQRLLRPRQHLDRVDLVAVAGHHPMVVGVGADQVRQDLGVPGVGLPATDVVAVSVPGHRFGVDRVHPVPGRDQRGDPQAVVGLDPDHHLRGVLSVLRDQRVEVADPSHSFGETPYGEFLPLGVHDMNVVMILRPVIPDEDQPDHLLDLDDNLFDEPRPPTAAT